MNKKNLAFLILALNPLATHAGTMGGVGYSNHYILSLSGGPVWTDAGKTETFFLQSDIEKTYAANKKNQVLGEAEIFIGRQQALSSSILSQIGLAVAASDNARLSGSIWEDANPELDNYFYNYRVNHIEAALKGKLVFSEYPIAQPYLSGKIALGFNHASDFTIKPKIFEEVPAPAFNSKTNTAFSYALGIGFQKAFTDQIQAGLGYEFADWGKSQLARAQGQTVNQGLGSNHLYTNSLQFSLTYLF